MTRIVKKIGKRIIKDYFEGWKRLYGPCIEAGINPFM